MATKYNTGHTIVSPRTRQVIYAVFAFGSVVLGAVQTGYSAGGYEQPTWLTIAVAVWVFLGGSQGLLALLNTAAPSPGEEAATIERVHT